MKKEQQIELGDMLIAHWKSLLTCECIPPAGKFIPDASLKPVLPHILILEIVDGDVKLGLLGPGHDGRLEVNPMGQSYLDTIPPERRYATMMRVQAMLQHKCGARIEIEEEMADGKLGTIFLTVVPYAADDTHGAYLVTVVPPNTLSEVDNTPTKSSFLSRPFKSFDYLDIGFGTPPPLAEK
ncbi:MAG: hypothetical protein P1U70_09785, partial [Saprospiraceae bacterium]|nr:hypothetical protein [Saprospiraceae bacterium]